MGRVFGPELDGLDRDRIRKRCNGYHWRGGERGDNPHDVLMLLRNRELRPDWYETEAPEFLFRMLVERGVSLMEPENRMADMLLLSKFDVDNIGIEALVFQTGYLTIVEEQRDEFDDFFRLDYPNLEEGAGLNRGLLQLLEKANMEYA